MKKLILFIIVMFSFSFVGCSASDGSNATNKNVEENLTEKDTKNESDTETQTNTDSAISDLSEDSVVTAECTWAYDVTEPSLVKEDSDYFLKVRVKTKEKTKYFLKDDPMPASTYNLEVLKVLMNDDGSVAKNIKIAVNGGCVSMQDYVNTMDSETQKKAGTDKLSKKELKENVLINDESYYELKQGQEYHIFVRDLTKDENYKGYYGVPAGGYGVFEERNGEYINVLTNRVLELE